MADTDNSNSAGGNGANGTSSPPPPPQGNTVMNHLLANKVETLLWLTRIFTVVSTIMFLLPIFGGNPYSLYQRALIASAATSALRLHQRLPTVQFNMDFLRRLLTEDSCHYLFFALLFINSYPITMAVVPVFLFALLHACSFTKALLNTMGPQSMQFLRNMIGKLEQQQVNILRFIACNEIFLMPAVVVMVFSGKASFFIPFVYYRFLTLRYASRRNPYCRTLFTELRMTVEYLCSKPQCPQFVRNLCFRAIAIISRMAPVVAAQ
ncbi:transmembrane protein 33-like [Babylonia areolata]|uniref:transmembrane protein 33-like n=1 Tax=Babylonia areolata TaxID=304850 RepID=UPI003FD494B3